ncbi:MAG: HypC/HybG/HupF family hydrogenase formation chaperone [Pseudomonadota bacterium]
MCLAIPGKVLSIDAADSLMRTGKVSFDGLVNQVSFALLPQAEVGSYVIVHAGFAISMVDEEAAERTLADLDSVVVDEGV